MPSKALLAKVMRRRTTRPGLNFPMKIKFKGVIYINPRRRLDDTGSNNVENVVLDFNLKDLFWIKYKIYLFLHRVNYASMTFFLRFLESVSKKTTPKA